jgi:hypothetical protein
MCSLIKQNQTSLTFLTSSEVILCREAHDSFHTRACIGCRKCRSHLSWFEEEDG